MSYTNGELFQSLLMVMIFRTSTLIIRELSVHVSHSQISKLISYIGTMY